MKHLKRIFESDDGVDKDPLSYLIDQSIENFDEIVMSNIEGLTQDERIEYLNGSRDALLKYMNKINSQLEVEIRQKIEMEDDPAAKLEAWMNKPYHSKSRYVVRALDKIQLVGGRRDFLSDIIYMDRHRTHSVIEILNEYFRDENGNLVVGVPINIYNNISAILTPEAVDAIIEENVDEFKFDW